MGKMMEQKQMVEMVGKVTAWYGRYVGQAIAEGQVDVEGMDVDTFLRRLFHWDKKATIPYEVAFGFLIQFLNYDTCAEVLNEFEWPDDDNLDFVDDLEK